MNISVIIPVYNVECYLPRCIESVLEQSYSNFELLLINDGSTDASGDICDDYSQRDHRIRVFHTDNKGVSAARNLGIEKAIYKWICFVDSDDWLEKDYIQNFFNVDIALERVLVSQGILFDYISYTKTFFSYNDIMLQGDFSHEIVQYQLLHNGCPYAKLFNKEIIVKNSIQFNEKISMHEDHIFVFEYMMCIDMIILNSGLSYHYMKQSAVSLSSKKHSSYSLCLASEHLIGLIYLLVDKFKIVDVSYINQTLIDYGVSQMVRAVCSITKKDYKVVFKYVRQNKRLWKQTLPYQNFSFQIILVIEMIFYLPSFLVGRVLLLYFMLKRKD